MSIELEKATAGELMVWKNQEKLDVFYNTV